MKSKGVVSYLLLGSNVGDRASHLTKALESLNNYFDIVAASSIYETDAWGDRSQNAYLNQAIMISLNKDPHELHAITRAIEKSMGRKEKGNYQPRAIDIDILFYENEIVQSEKLIIPHPRIQIRRFVLTPMCELASDYVHPVFRQTMSEMLEECDDVLEVCLFVTGP